MALDRSNRYPGRFENPTTASPQGAFKNRTSPTAQDGSYFEADWANDWDGFFGRLLTLARVSPNGKVDTASSSQYYDALKSLFLQRTSPFADIKADGTVPTALENLGLGAGSALPVGVPVPYPLATPPTGWMKCNGSTFNLASYPALAAVFPSGTLPDLRGEFIRGWDDGRGVDVGRTILTAQEDMIKSHEHSVWRRGDDKRITQSLNINDPGTQYLSVVHSASVIEGRDIDSLYAVPTGGSETRPRNIAFNYIVRAA